MGAVLLHAIAEVVKGDIIIIFLFAASTEVIQLPQMIYYAPFNHCTKVHFASFLSGGFTTKPVINQPERKLAKRTSVQFLQILLTLGDRLGSVERCSWTGTTARSLFLEP